MTGSAAADARVARAVPAGVPFWVPLALAGLLAGWLLLDRRGGDPWPVVGALAVASATFLAGRLVPPAGVPWVALAAGAGYLGAVLLGSGPLDGTQSGPLGYANANAALAVQGGAACAVAVAAARHRILVLLGWAAVLASAVLTLLMGAYAATAGAVLVAAVLLARARPWRGAAVGLCLAALVAASGLAFVVGWLGAPAPVEQAVTVRRVQLWVDGVAAIGDRPWRGVGAREFRAASPTAAGDADTREAHAELLQRTVENGVVGGVLEAAAIAAVVVGLTRRSGPESVVGLAGLAAVWANAGVDYVLAFPAVVAPAFLLAGLAWPRAAGQKSSTSPMVRLHEAGAG